MCGICDLIDETTDPAENSPEPDRSITRVPLTDSLSEQVADLGDEFVVEFYALASPLFGMMGEVATHVVGLAKPCESHGREIAILGANEDGGIVGFMPVTTNTEPGATIAETLAGFGFVDVTGE